LAKLSEPTLGWRFVYTICIEEVALLMNTISNEEVARLIHVLGCNASNE
jgi:hypothetical protein